MRDLSALIFFFNWHHVIHGFPDPGCFTDKFPRKGHKIIKAASDKTALILKFRKINLSI